MHQPGPGAIPAHHPRTHNCHAVMNPATPRYVSFDIPLSPNLSPGDFAHLAPEKMREYHTKGLQLQLEQFWQVGFGWWVAMYHKQCMAGPGAG